jgi:hypothetical protein
MPQEIFLFLIVVGLGGVLWFFVAALLKSSSTKAEREIKDVEAEKQLGSLTDEMLTMQREQQNLALAQERTAEKLDGLRDRLEQAKREIKQAELDLLMKRHLALDGEIERLAEELLRQLQQSVASLEQMKRLGSELNLSKDLSLSFGFLTAYMAGKMRAVFRQGLSVAPGGRQQNLSKQDKELFHEVRQQMKTSRPEGDLEGRTSELSRISLAVPTTNIAKPGLRAPQFPQPKPSDSRLSE